MLMLRKKRGNKGFTLIELMVVVAILAILAIVAIPRVMDALERSRNSEAIATATAIRDGMTRFYADFEVYPGSNKVEDAEEMGLILTKGWDTGPVLHGTTAVGEDPFTLDLGDTNAAAHTAWGTIAVTTADLEQWIRYRSAMYNYLDIRNVAALTEFEYQVPEDPGGDDRDFLIIITFLNATGNYERCEISPEFVRWSEDGVLPSD